MRKESEEPELEPGEVIACRYRVEAHYRTHPLGELYRCSDLSNGANQPLEREASPHGGRRPSTGGFHGREANQPLEREASVLLQRLRREFALPGVQDRLFETRGSASLESSVIADILDYGEDIDGRPFLVTPWSEDASLDAVERPLGFAEAVAIVLRVAEALAPLHAQGMLHGGIEPASVLVDHTRELTGLLGFGLAPALAAGADRTRALPLLVSPGYAAPELITGQPLGPQADVYALGILLWELIFAQVPFRGAILRVLDAHLNRALPDVELPFDAPASFEPTLRRMLAKRPEDRFADAGAVAEQLRRHLLEQPVLLEADPDEDEDETVVFEVVPEAVSGPRFRPEPEPSRTEAVSGPRFRPEPEPSRTEAVREAVREGTDVVRMQPRVLELELEPEFEPTSFARPRSRVLPRLAVALTMCASLVLLGTWAFERDRTRVSAEQSSGARVEHASASASSIQPSQSSQSIAVEATRQVGQPVAAKPIDLAPAPTREQPELHKLGPSKFRAHKDELYAGIERVCTKGGVRRTMKLAVRVDGRGRVEAATVLGKMGASQLGQCVERQAKRLEFPATREGGYYVYTLRLRP